MKALTFSKFGGAEVLEYRDVPTPEIGRGEVLVEMEAIGLNFADIYRRQGRYHLTGEPPYIAGYEGAGVVVESNDRRFSPGDHVGFADVPLANAEFVSAPMSHLIPLPGDVEFSIAASVLLQGLTAQYLVTDSHSVRANEWVLVHAASGGVGQILVQLCKRAGAKVIGLTRSDDKKAIIIGCGADAAFNLKGDWIQEVRALTGSGVDVCYDSVGSTLMDCFEVTKARGHVVFYGMSGGDPPPVDPRMLMDGSKTLTGGDLWGYLTSREERESRAAQLFAWIRKGELTVKPATQFSLADGARAHEFLESGKSTGKVLMIP